MRCAQIPDESRPCYGVALPHAISVPQRAAASGSRERARRGAYLPVVPELCSQIGEQPLQACLPPVRLLHELRRLLLTAAEACGPAYSHL